MDGFTHDELVEVLGDMSYTELQEACKEMFIDSHSMNEGQMKQALIQQHGAQNGDGHVQNPLAPPAQNGGGTNEHDELIDMMDFNDAMATCNDEGVYIQEQSLHWMTGEGGSAATSYVVW